MANFNSTTSHLSDAELVAPFTRTGSKVAAARELGISEVSYRRALSGRGIVLRAPHHPNSAKGGQGVVVAERASITTKGDDCTIVSEATPEQLGDVSALLRERGLDPDEWIIVQLTINSWDGMTKVSSEEDRLVTLHQLKVVLKRKITWQLLSPAVQCPPLKRTGRVKKGEPEQILVLADHQVPFHDPKLHEAMLALISKVEPHEIDMLGDLLDFSTISRHGDHPSTNGITPQICVVEGHRVLRDIREAARSARIKKLKGNHDWRLESEQLARAERIYDLCPAGEDIPALDLRRLLHLDKLDIELITDPRGWEHAEITIVEGPHGLVARHGWLTGNNTSERSVKARGRSMIVAHIHKREHSFYWDPSMEIERQGMVIGCMCLVRSQRYPHYVALDRWLQGAGMVTRWPNSQWEMEHIRWEDGALRWRGERFTA